MKLYVLVLFSALQLCAINGEKLNPRHRDLRLKRQPASAVAAPAVTNAPPPPSPPSQAAPSSPSSPPPPPPPPPPPSSQSTSTSAGSASAGASSTASTTGSTTLSGNVNATSTTQTGPPPLDTGTGVPPLPNITLGMPTQAPLAISSTYAAGATVPISGAPALPTLLPLSTWPPLDKVPDTSSPEVQAWLKELDGFNIPDLDPTVDGSCASSPAFAADAADRGWWTCGGYTRNTDIVACPEYLTWGVSFDDGPSPYTQKLLNYLDQNDINATFFVVGSRCAEYPNILKEEYMSGHEISVHTWSHPHLTTLTNAQIVAELGWTRKVIKATLGITPLTMRPPFGDIDDRVRAISLAMGLIPVIWTSTPSGGKFDTNDWMVAGGSLPGNQSFLTFDNILNNATLLTTGFIVLEHDLFEITVDLAVGYTLNAARSFQPKLNLQPIGQCTGLAPDNIYLETNKNTTFPYRNETSSGGDSGIDVDGNGQVVPVGSTSGSSAGFITTIPVLSSLGLCAIVVLSIMF